LSFGNRWRAPLVSDDNVAELGAEMKEKLDQSLNLAAHVVSSYGAYIMH